MVVVVQNIGRIAVGSGRFERSRGWVGLGGREGGKGRRGRQVSIARGACSIPKGHGTVVMEDMVISGIGLLAGVFGLVGSGLVWLGIVKYRGVSYSIFALGTRYLRHALNLRTQR